MTPTTPHIITNAHQPLAPKFVAGESDKAREMLIRQKEMFRAQIAQNSDEQLAWQNAQPIYSAIRLNGKLVGTMGVNTGLTMTGISDGGAFRRAVAYAEKTGMSGEEFSIYATEQLSQALKARYGASIEIEVFAPDSRPTSGEMHAEMFGTATPAYDSTAAGSPASSESELSYMKLFAQIYAQNFGEDPFADLNKPYED